MLKTPLPEKFKAQIVIDNNHECLEPVKAPEQAINQLITYLAELTEVVEGKSCRHCEVAEQQGVTHIHTLTLKEQLLREISKIKKDILCEFEVGSERSTPFLIRANGYNNALIDVEAIINCLMP